MSEKDDLLRQFLPQMRLLAEHMQGETEAEQNDGDASHPIDDTVGRQRQHIGKKSERHLHDSITIYGCRKAVTVFFIRIAIDENILKEVSQCDGDACTQKSPMLVGDHHQEDERHKVRRL